MHNGLPAHVRITKELAVSYIVDFRGHPACPCQAAWLPAFEAEAQRRGILRGPLPLSQLIGGAPQSGGTHTDGGADDTYPLDSITDVDAYVWLSRQMGADATWERPYDWDGRGGVRHVHRVLTGCPHNEPARYQIDAVRADLNGLANHGSDTGPRPLSGRTWREGIAWAQAQQEDDMADPKTQELLAQIAKDAQEGRTAAQQAVHKLDAQRERQRKQAQRIVARLDELKDTGATGAQVAELRGAVVGMLSDDEDD